MCKMNGKSIWDLKSKFRKSIQLNNRTILVIERVQEDREVRQGEAIEMLICEKDLYESTVDALRRDGFDI
jgi:hypothetical protein